MRASADFVVTVGPEVGGVAVNVGIRLTLPLDPTGATLWYQRSARTSPLPDAHATHATAAGGARLKNSGHVLCCECSGPELAQKGLLVCWAERVRSAPVVQTSTFSAISRASSTSTPRYRTVLSIFEWPSKSCTARRLPVRR